MKTGGSFFNLSDLKFSALMVIAAGGISIGTIDAGVKDEAAKVFMNFGSASGGNPATYSFVSRIKSDYNALVCENAMKFQPTEPNQGSFSYSGGDQVVSFCQTNNMLVRGHTMVWGGQNPTWITGLSRQQMLAALKNHITNLMTHWKGKITEWDIVNEAVADGGSGGLKGIFWQKTIGNDYLDSAFTYAHEADPNVYLYYNDYSGESAGSVKSDYIYNMVKGMVQRGIPIHGVGLQCHLSSPVSKDKISANIKRIGDLGLRVSCTETDIKNSTSDAASWSNLVQACVENYNATTFMCWGFDDGHSWIGNPCNCQMWDQQDNPKTALVTAVQNAFSGGDPAVAAKRKAFISLTPEQLLAQHTTSVRLNLNYKPVSHFAYTNGSLSYFLPVNQHVRLQVFTMQGKTVLEMNLGRQTTGTHSVRLSGLNLPVGLYFAKINSGELGGRFQVF
jgi:GH35 family endo-1,4-beta-xylanase